VVEVERIASRNGYSVGGVAQLPGDRCRLPLGEAERLVRDGKAHIVSGTERLEVM